MRSVKIVLLLLVLIFLGVAVYQNLGVLTHEQTLRLEIPFFDKYESRPFQLFIYFLACFFVGLLLSYFYGLAGRFKASKTIKIHLDTIRKLEEDIKALKSVAAQRHNPPSEQINNPNSD